MLQRARALAQSAYERLLERELSDAPSHVAVIQDGNRRYAREQGAETTEGYTEGAETTEALLHWCDELGVDEVTLYTFSTENFDRPKEQREHLFDLIEQKLTAFADADRVHDNEVRIRAIGETDMLPERVRDAIDYAEDQTAEYDRLHLNVALAYGGRAELLGATRDIARSVDDGHLDPAAVDADTIEGRLYEGPTRDVDLIVRTGGDERTSNFLPWHAKGNEAAVYFCAPYWPEFRKIDFLRAIRTYEHRAASWRRTRARRALTLVRALGPEASQARRILGRFRDALTRQEREAVEDDVDVVAD
ncbi:MULTISPECIES: polyprenyl diphosphate synthase [unclassified Halomicrobium]|uniref:polyprenyl diphosphate synthase n=1 Tax=unclassified Halomicrobium TaxID=2610901 RepID=UPI0012982BD8|nr:MULTISPECIES: polyprenyl diphosphate synthase [unclassified Halomicrobium]MBO4249359.1 di-trans,poly-cis-decaprenylcistransferase [Halomicrobium sp. IBSBa]QGA81827.1 Tritrans,polycis-undecaprenyl-diphosphate synthase (geranylgeranyl diphosphate specific) [Halomicrobium sp. LC1Hm]